MTKSQKTIKYFALVFALFLIVNIVSDIIYSISCVSSIFDNKKNNELNNIETIIDNVNNDVNILNIDIKYSKLIIKKSEKFHVETNNKYVIYNKKNNELYISEKKHSWKKNNYTLTIYIQNNIFFVKTTITTGAGKIKIEELNTNDMHFEMGAGQVIIDKLNVLSSTEIEGGAGKINIKSATINNLKLNMGVGKIDFTGIISGKSKIEAGIGSLNINLEDKEKNYKLYLEKGLGSIKVNNEKQSNNSTYGNGSNYIKIEGGIGDINIKFN